MQTLGVTFLSQTMLGAIFTLIFRTLPRFSANQTFGDALATPAPPAPTPLLFITVA